MSERAHAGAGTGDGTDGQTDGLYNSITPSIGFNFWCRGLNRYPHSYRVDDYGENPLQDGRYWTYVGMGMMAAQGLSGAISA